MMKILLTVFLLCCTGFSFASTKGVIRSGGKLYKEQKYGQALAKYQQALQNNPQHKGAAFGAGAAAYYLKDYEMAKDFFGQVAEEKNPRQQDALFNLGNTHYRAGDRKQAKQAYRQAIIKNPKDKEAIHNLQLILNDEKNQQNQNNKNDQNQKNDSDNNQDKHDDPNQSGDSAKQEPEQEDFSRESADRVLQMARENEYKRPAATGQAEREYIEKDW